MFLIGALARRVGVLGHWRGASTWDRRSRSDLVLKVGRKVRPDRPTRPAGTLGWISCTCESLLGRRAAPNLFTSTPSPRTLSGGLGLRNDRARERNISGCDPALMGGVQTKLLHSRSGYPSSLGGVLNPPTRSSGKGVDPQKRFHYSRLSVPPPRVWTTSWKDDGLRSSAGTVLVE